MSDVSSEHQKLKAKPKFDFGSPLRVIGTVLLAFLASQLVAVIVIQIALGIFRGGASLNDLLTSSASAQFFYVLLAEGLAIAIIYLFLRRRKLGFAQIGLGRRPRWRDLKVALAGFGIFYVLLITATVVISALVPSFDVEQAQDVGFESLNNSLDKLIAFVALVLIPPVGEEILMRGYLFTGLRARLNFVRAGLITSVIFGLAHLEFGSDGPLVWVAGLATFILSLVLVYTREKTGALYAPIMIHMFNNSVAFSIHFL